MPPKVSVCVIAYNQEAYIDNCLEHILRQRTNFDFELVIGEDCSTDGTAAIISQRAVSHKNMVVLDHGYNRGVLPNFIRTLKACTGTYIAFCEGDDYWIDDHKLQKQVDFLEANPQYGGVCTNNRWFFEKENTFKDSVLEEGAISFEDLAESNKINSQTILFRRELIDDLDWMNDLKIGDWPLHLSLSNQKPYYRLPEITTVYRVHSGGIHSLLEEEQKIRNRAEVLMAVLKNLDLSIGRKDLLKTSLRNLLKKLIGYHAADMKTTRSTYYNYGGGFFNKTILKSYIK